MQLAVFAALLASCSSGRPQQENFLLQKAGGDRQDLRSLTQKFAGEQGLEIEAKQTQWDGSTYTDSYDLSGDSAGIHLRNSLKSCGSSEVSADQKPYTLFVSVYSTSPFKARASVDRYSSALKSVANRDGWKTVSQEQCDGTL